MEIHSFFSPGRFNIIGEHTDHQGGLVLPGCIQLGITFHGCKTDNNTAIIHSKTLNETDIFDVTDFDLEFGWKRYVRGIFRKIIEIKGQISGVKIWIESNLPTAGGLSSSAALEIGLLNLLSKLFNFDIKPWDIIKAAHFVENNYVGVQCGIMDQTIIQLGKVNTAVKLDCNNLTTEYINLSPEISFILVNTNTQRKLEDSQYNIRIQELSTAYKKIRKNNEFQSVSHISALSEDNINQISEFLPDLELRRVRHVLTENKRVIDYGKLMERGKYEEAGKLLYNSHRSLQFDFDASWERADMLIDILEKEMPIIHGARMVGAGWGGSILIQLERKNIDIFFKHFEEIILDKFQEKLDILVIKASKGISEIKSSLRDEIHIFFNSR